MAKTGTPVTPGFLKHRCLVLAPLPTRAPTSAARSTLRLRFAPSWPVVTPVCAMGVEGCAMSVDGGEMGMDGGEMGVDGVAMGVDGYAMGVDGCAMGVRLECDTCGWLCDGDAMGVMFVCMGL